MRLEQALVDLQCIHAHLERTQRASCYRSASIGGSGVVALVAGVGQPYWMPAAAQDVVTFFGYWSLVAVASVVLIGAEIGFRYAWRSTALLRQQTRQSLAEFFPFVAVGALLGWAVLKSAPEHVSMLPAVWACLFGLGVLASRHRLPAGGIWIAGYYWLAAVLCVQWGTGPNSLAPWTISLTFGTGQLLTAALLYFYSEVRHGQEASSQ